MLCLKLPHLWLNIALVALRGIQLDDISKEKVFSHRIPTRLDPPQGGPDDLEG